MSNNNKNHNKKKSLKRIFRIIAIMIAALLAVDICMTVIFTQKIPHRYASAEEGKELMLSNTEYYSNYTQNDIEFRLKKSGATMEELLEVSTNEIRDYNVIEKYFIITRSQRWP